MVLAHDVRVLRRVDDGFLAQSRIRPLRHMLRSLSDALLDLFWGHFHWEGRREEYVSDTIYCSHDQVRCTVDSLLVYSNLVASGANFLSPLPAFILPQRCLHGSLDSAASAPHAGLAAAGRLHSSSARGREEILSKVRRSIDPNER